MKRTFISSALLLFCALHVAAQHTNPGKSKKCYIRLGLGYTMPHSGQTEMGGLGINGSTTVTSTYASSNEISSSTRNDLKRASFGSGVNGVAALGVTLHRNIAIELGIGIGIAPQKYKYSYKETATSTAPTYTDIFSVQSTKYQKTPVFILPAIVLQTDGEKVNVYSRLGVVLPVAGKLMDERKYTQDNSGSPFTGAQEETYEIKTRFAVGFHGALGIQWNLDRNFALFAEVNGMSMNAYAKKATLTRLTIGGVDYLSQASMAQKETEFEFSEEELNTAPSNAPSKAKTFAIPYSNIGVGIGFKFRI